MKKFNCLLFIDDDYPTNYYHREIATEADVAEQLVFFRRASAALDYLKSGGYPDRVMPEIIFLDINMPEINGWEFLDHYEAQVPDKSPAIIMLSTSLNPADQHRAEYNGRISAFWNKPLTVELLQALHAEHLG